MGTSCRSETKSRSCWGFVDRVTFHRYLLRKREGCSRDGAKEEEEEFTGITGFTLFYLSATPAPRSLPRSTSWRRATVGHSRSTHGMSMWVALSVQKGWVGERKEGHEISAHETKTKAGLALPFPSFLTARQPQLRCN